VIVLLLLFLRQSFFSVLFVGSFSVWIDSATASKIMAGIVNKRQQARNERALQELIKTVPGNDKCAECGAKNPGTTHELPQWVV
jgi:hypothetical protein